MLPSLTARRVQRDVDVVARAGLDIETFLQEAVESISRAVPHVGTCIATVDPSTLLLTGTLKFGDLRGQDEHDHEFGLIEYGDEEDSTFRRLAVSDRAATAVGAGSSARVADFMRPNFGYTEEARVVMRDAGQVWGAMALFRGSDAGPFADDEVELLDSLSSTLGIGVRAGLLANFAPAPATAPEGPAVVIVGADDTIQQMSAGAEVRLMDLMRSEDGTVADGIVSSLIGAARRWSAGLTPAPPRCRVRSRSGMWLVLHATPMSPRADGSGGDVVVTIDEARPPEIVPLVVAAFDLTPRERDVTQLVLQGVDTKEIASAMHVSPYTVQDHLKSVFAKADVRSRRELIAKIYFDQYVPRMGTDVGPTGWFAGG
jgi:DNA-binding CsgD family transcriptional regulator